MFKGKNEIVIIKAFGLILSSVYLGVKLVWDAIRSCFGSGKWVGNKPWIGKEKWKGFK